MKTRCISGLVVALALSAAITLFAQTPSGGAQTPPGGRGGGRGATSLRPKSIDAPDIKFEVVKDFMKLPPNVYMGEGIGIATNSKGHVFVNTCAQQTRNFEFDRRATSYGRSGR